MTFTRPDGQGWPGCLISCRESAQDGAYERNFPTFHHVPSSNHFISLPKGPKLHGDFHAADRSTNSNLSGPWHGDLQGIAHGSTLFGATPRGIYALPLVSWL